jgi:hypothetical protein
MAGFELVIFWSGGGCDDHYAKPPGHPGYLFISVSFLITLPLETVFFKGFVGMARTCFRIISKENPSFCFISQAGLSVAGLPDFSRYIIPKPEKMYQMNTKCTKWS